MRIWVAASAILLTALRATGGEAKQASSATDFLDSIGVCTHVGQGVDDPTKSAESLAFAGIRNIRDDASERHIDDWIVMHTKSGVRVVLTQSGPRNESIPKIIDMSKKLAGAQALLAMEGPNEPNNWAVTFDGKKSDAKTSLPIAQWQAAFYKAAKSDSVLKDYPVFHSSEAGGSEVDNVGLQFLTIPSRAGTLMPDGTKFADFANVHNYISRKPAVIDNMAWQNADPTFHGWTDGVYVEYGKTWRKNFAGYSDADLQKLPRVTTETGWVTGGKHGLTEVQQGRLYLNMFLAQFARGFKYTFIYMLRDAGGSDAGYGIVTTDYQPKKSATYLHNLTTILADKSSAKSVSAKLSYTIQNQPQTVHDLLLMKSNGKFDLVVWNERANGSDDVTIQFDKDRDLIQVFDPTEGTVAIQTLNHTRTVSAKLTDHPIIIELP